MKVKFKDRLSAKVVLLTLIMASMTLLSSVVGIISLSEFKKEYQQIKEKDFDLLLKVTEFKAQTDDIIHISTQMLLSGNMTELEWDLLDISDKRLWIDKLFSQLTGHTNDHQALLILKLRLYSHIDEIARAVTAKFEFSEPFLKRYSLANALKIKPLERGDLQLYIVLDRAISHFNPIVNKQLSLNAEREISALLRYINNPSSRLDPNERQAIEDLFLGDNSMPVSYQYYARQLDSFENLRIKNEEFSALFVSSLRENVSRLQERFIAKLARLEESMKKRQQRLYLVVFSCLFITVFLLFTLLNFIRRINLVRRVIGAGESDRKMDFLIKGEDEISEMALSVKGYIERLVSKEKELLAINKQFEHLTSHDPLTTIFNRSYFESFLKQENTRYIRYKEVYCVAVIDLDFFKKVNENYGHDAGDSVLIEFTKRVLLIIRQADIFARFGGEEFVLLMPNTVKKNALMLMQRIRLAVAEKPHTYNEQPISFAVSIGLTEVQRSQGSDALKQLALADRALYEAKNAGRNRVCVYTK